MLKSKSSFFEEDIVKATHENNTSEDWALIMHICDNAINYDGGAKLCLKAIIKRLYHQVPRVVLQTLTLLDACVKNCDRRFLLQVASSEFISEVRKLLSKMHPSAANKLKELLQKWSLEDFKDDPELGIIPSLYYKLKSEGVEFPAWEDKKKGPVLCTNPDGVSSQEEEEDIIKAIEISLKDTGRYQVPDEYKNVQPTSTSQTFSEPMKVRALYDFDAAEDNELTIKTGEIVVVLDYSNESWWKGSNHRGEGLFPSNFVTKDLDAVSEEPKVAEAVAKTESSLEDDVEVELDEKKIELVINWLNETDPTADISDPEDMLRLEKQCHNMAPKIEENLQSIDKRLAMLNSLNEKLMDAFSLFHSLSDSTPVTSQTSKFYPGTLNPHIVQFPHPQFSTLPPGTMLHPSMQNLVPQELNAASAVPQSNDQANPQPVQTTVQTSVVQEIPKSSSVNNTFVNTMPVQEITNSNLPNQAAASNNTPAASVPFNPVYNFSMMGGYCIPPAAMPYPVQCDPNMQRPGFAQNPVSSANVMTFPYGVSPMRPYFPFPYYYVNSNPSQNVSHPVTAGEPVQAVSQTQVNPTTAAAVNTSTASIPVVSSYSNDLNSLNLSTNSSGVPVSKQEILSEQHACEVAKNEVMLNKSL